VCYVEREAYSASILVERMEEKALGEAPVWDDVSSFRGSDFRGLVDIVTAGYPCQPFSYAGKRGGSDDERNLWPHIRRIISEAEPAWVFLENVPGHLTLGFEAVSEDLRGMGYRVEAGLFSADELGASHIRKRLFCLAHNPRHGCERIRLSIQPGRPYQEGPDLGREGRDVGVAHIPGLEGRTMLGDERSDERIARETIGPFPPGPEDHEGWEHVLKIDQGLEPAVFRVVDGTSQRVDRLHSLGNGVVPLVVAHAFLSLYSLFVEE
jgi:DNA (cytosine-5)-methyltransferase 1